MKMQFLHHEATRAQYLDTVNSVSMVSNPATETVSCQFETPNGRMELLKVYLLLQKVNSGQFELGTLWFDKLFFAPKWN